MKRRAPAPWLFAILNAPHAVVTGGVSGTLLSFLLRQQGVAPHAIANQRALLLLPATLFFLWSPVTDFLLRRKTWLLISTAASSLTLMLALESGSYASKSAVTLLWTSSCLILLASAAMGGLVALLMRQEQKTRVGCFLQAGNLAGGALSGGGLLLLATHFSKMTLGLAAGALTFLPALPVLLFDEPPVAKRGVSFAEEMLVMGREFKKTFLRLSALPAVLLLVSPLGSGGAIGILSSIAKDYGVSGNQVAWTNGLMGGVLTFAGAHCHGPDAGAFRHSDGIRGHRVGECGGTERVLFWDAAALDVHRGIGAVSVYGGRLLGDVQRPGAEDCGRSGAQRLRTVCHGSEPGEPAGGLHGGARWLGCEVVRGEGIAGDRYGGERSCVAGVSGLVLVGAGEGV